MIGIYPILTYSKINNMATKLHNNQIDDEIQLYRSDFFGGVVQLIKKLFML